MDDPDFYMNALSVALGGGAGGATAWAVLHTRLSAAGFRCVGLPS